MRKPVRILDLENPGDSAIRAAGGPWNSYGPIYYVEDTGFIVREKHYPYVTTATTLRAADLSSLEAALRGWGDTDDDQEAIFLAEEDGRLFHPEDSDWISGLSFKVKDGHLVGVVEENFRDETSVPVGVQSICGAALAEHKSRVVNINPHVEWSDDYLGDKWLMGAYPDNPRLLEHVRAEIATTQAAQPRTIRVTFGLLAGTGSTGDLLEAARDLQELLRAHSRGGGVSTTTVRAWLRAGRFSLLKGLPESEWLEIKSQSYQVGKNTPTPQRNQAKVELAQDVARFANGSHDALLVLGFSETKEHGQDVVSELKPVDFAHVDVTSYRDILDARIVPPLDGVTIELLESAPGEGVVLIFVPKQAPEMQPYLVHGAIAEGRYEGDFFSIVQRRGEGSITTTAQQIHAYIVAGRRYLKDL